MPTDPGRETFPELWRPAEVGDALAVLAGLLAPLLLALALHLRGGLGLGCVGLLALLGAAAAVLHLDRPRGQRLEIEVGADGLTERRWREPDRHWRWSDITGVTQHPLGATIQSPRGDLEIGSSLANRLRLLRRVRDRLGLVETRSTDGSVERETVADWAGIESWETLAVTIPPRLERFRHAFWVFGLLAAGAVGFGYGWSLGPLVAALGYLGGVQTVAHGLGTKRVIKVSPDGLAIHGWRPWFCSWDEVAAVEPEEDGFRIVTEQGDFVLGYRTPDEQQLVHLCQRATAHRERGLALPRMGEVSDAAISRAGMSERVDDAGLSLVQPAERE